MQRVYILVIAALTPALAQVSITAKPDTIDLGGAITLAWSSPGNSAFIEGLGLVPSKGSRHLSPARSQTFTLVSEGPTGIRYASTRIKVNGERGDSIFPDPDDFPPGVSDHRRSIQYPDFLNLVTMTLQDALKFRVRGQHLPTETFYVFITDRQLRPSLIRPADRGIRSRRIAYWVRAEEPRSQKDVPFEVKAIVEYQRLAEAKWRPETDQQLVTELETQLKQQLLTAAAGTIK